jgi:hypothetical protein
MGGEDILQSIHTFSDSHKLSTPSRRESIMHKLEEGTEGTMTLVGSLEFIKKPLAGLVRLSHAVVMPNLMEIPVPVRFIFILFTPKVLPDMDCLEVGRSFSTLMSFKVGLKKTCQDSLFLLKN